jgi:hypothetical protein
MRGCSHAPCSRPNHRIRYCAPLFGSNVATSNSWQACGSCANENGVLVCQPCASFIRAAMHARGAKRYGRTPDAYRHGSRVLDRHASSLLQPLAPRARCARLALRAICRVLTQRLALSTAQPRPWRMGDLSAPTVSVHCDREGTAPCLLDTRRTRFRVTLWRSRDRHPHQPGMWAQFSFYDGLDLQLP